MMMETCEVHADNDKFCEEFDRKLSNKDMTELKCIIGMEVHA
jgi:hypothetical protein